LDQAIQEDKKGLVIAKVGIDVPLEEKSAECEPLAYTSNQEIQEVKDTSMEEISMED